MRCLTRSQIKQHLWLGQLALTVLGFPRRPGRLLRRLLPTRRLVPTCRGWRSCGWIVVVLGITSGAALAALSLVLWTIYRLNPEKVRFQATLTRWLSIDLEMQSPR